MDIIFDCLETGLASSSSSSAENLLTPGGVVVNLLGERANIMTQNGVFRAAGEMKKCEAKIQFAMNKPSPTITILPEDDFMNFASDFRESSSTSIESSGGSSMFGKIFQSSPEFVDCDGDLLTGFSERLKWPRSSFGALYGYTDKENAEQDDLDLFTLGETTSLIVDEEDEKSNPPVDNAGLQLVESIRDFNNLTGSPGDAIVFFSAPFCKTCKRINFEFQRLARVASNKNNPALRFGKCEGKKNSRALQVRAHVVFWTVPEQLPRTN